MKCPSTGEFRMYMLADSNGYRNPTVEYAVADILLVHTNTKVPYYLVRNPLIDGIWEPFRRWYWGVIMHHGNLYKFSEDYKSVVENTL